MHHGVLAYCGLRRDVTLNEYDTIRMIFLPGSNKQLKIAQSAVTATVMVQVVTF